MSRGPFFDQLVVRSPWKGLIMAEPLTLDTLPALDELTHLVLDQLAGELEQQTGWAKPSGWDYSMTKADKYQALVEELTPADSPSEPERAPEPTVNPIDNHTRIGRVFLVEVVDSGTKLRISYRDAPALSFTIRADELDDLRSTLS